MQAKLLFYSFITLFFTCQTLSIQCNIMRYVIHQRHITLLGDLHALKSNELESQHLKAIVQKIGEKTNPFVMLVEDPYEPLSKKLKTVSPDFLKISLLKGLIQRINYFQPSVQTVGIDRGDVVGRACYFAQYFWRRLCFESLPPHYLIKHSRLNAYYISFQDLINEATQYKKALLARRKPEYAPCVHAFIDRMGSQMDEQLTQLKLILEDQHIKPSDSILATTVRWWVLQMMAWRKGKIAEIQSLGRAFEDFIRDYTKGMTDEEWKYRIEDLNDRRSQIFEQEPEPLVIKPSCAAQILTAAKNLPFIRNFVLQPAGLPAEQSSRELTALSDPSRGFQDQNGKLDRIFKQLRLLIVDPHTVLDIYDRLGTDMTVIAGDDHVKNISEYLIELGIERIDGDVRDPTIMTLLLKRKNCHYNLP